MRRQLFALVALLSIASSVRAQTPCYADNDGPNYFDAVSMSQAYVAIQFTPATSFSATRLEIFSGEANGASSVQLWTNDASTNQPLAALGSGAFNLAAPVDWQGANLSTPIAVVAGQTYWFVWSTVNNCQSSIDVAMQTLGQPYRASFDNGQTWGTLFQFTDRH